jgi:hypothetical protein
MSTKDLSFPLVAETHLQQENEVNWLNGNRSILRFLQHYIGIKTPGAEGWRHSNFING